MSQIDREIRNGIINPDSHFISLSECLECKYMTQTVQACTTLVPAPSGNVYSGNPQYLLKSIFCPDGWNGIVAMGHTKYKGIRAAYQTSCATVPVEYVCKGIMHWNDTLLVTFCMPQGNEPCFKVNILHFYGNRFTDPHATPIH